MTPAELLSLRLNPPNHIKGGCGRRPRQTYIYCSRENEHMGPHATLVVGTGKDSYYLVWEHNDDTKIVRVPRCG